MSTVWVRAAHSWNAAPWEWCRQPADRAALLSRRHSRNTLMRWIRQSHHEAVPCLHSVNCQGAALLLLLEPCERSGFH